MREDDKTSITTSRRRCYCSLISRNYYGTSTGLVTLSSINTSPESVPSRLTSKQSSVFGQLEGMVRSSYCTPWRAKEGRYHSQIEVKEATKEKSTSREGNHDRLLQRRKI